MSEVVQALGLVASAPFPEQKLLMPMNPMSDGNYSGGGPPDEDIAEDPETTDDSEVGGKSALLPKSFFQGEPKVGDTITIRIDAIFSDELEVSVVSESETETETQQTLSASDEIDAAAMGGME